MRTLFFALALTAAAACSAGAQERVRTGDLPAAAAQAAPATRATPARVSDQAKRLRGTSKAAPGVRASVSAARGARPMPARVKRPAPRG